jgi:diaminopimelate decarboxylase
MNAFQYRDGRLFCEDVPVAGLAEEFGTPTWVYSKAQFLHQLSQIQTAFAEVDPVICYSVKANSNLSILKLMSEAGASFDVVSGGELFRVKQAGADTKNVVFAGVGKTDDEIRYALECDILKFDVESEAELDAIGAIAQSMNTVGRVALRLNPDIDAKTHSKTTTGKKGNKFGMDIERAGHLADKVLANPHLQLSGIHMHLGSPIHSTEPYERASAKAIEVVREYRSKGHEISWINLGGGFAISYKHNEGLDAAEYAKVIVPAVKEAGCRLALEPGRFIAGNSGILLTRVVYTKREGGKLFIIQDGGMNDLARPAIYDSFHRVWPVTPTVPMPDDAESRPDGCEAADVVGPICESCDYFAKDRYLPPVNRGDLLSTFSAGAYGTVMSNNYNSRPRGAEILVDGDSYKVVRKPETLEDLVRHELVDH